MLYHFLELFHDFVQLWKNLVCVQTKVLFEIFHFLILEADTDQDGTLYETQVY